MKKFQVLIISLLFGCVLGMNLPNTASAADLISTVSPIVGIPNSPTPSSTVTAPGQALGTFSNTASPGPAGSVTLLSGSVLFCYLNATNVHLSTYAPNNVAANAVVTCDSGQSIRISSIVVTLHKVGSVLINHFFNGPSLGGIATSSTPFQYNSLKVLCISATPSIYWSTAHAVGVYSDGSSATADSTSPQMPSMSCGTNF